MRTYTHTRWVYGSFAESRFIGESSRCGFRKMEMQRRRNLCGAEEEEEDGGIVAVMSFQCVYSVEISVSLIAESNRV